MAGDQESERVDNKRDEGTRRRDCFVVVYLVINVSKQVEIGRDRIVLDL